jgi:hypothetical protein
LSDVLAIIWGTEHSCLRFRYATFFGVKRADRHQRSLQMAQEVERAHVGASRLLHEQLGSLTVQLGDLSDEDVQSLQLKLEVLDQWARLRDSADDMLHDHDTNNHHDHEVLFDIAALAQERAAQTAATD